MIIARELASGIVNEGIRALLNLFIYLFLPKDFTHTKSTKSTKSTKRQTSEFPPLRCFHVHKNPVFFCFTHKKAQKAQKVQKHK